MCINCDLLTFSAISWREPKKKKEFLGNYAKGKVHSLLNLFLKFSYIALIGNRLMAIYRVHIRCSPTVSAGRKFLWKNAASFSGRLVCAVYLSFDRFSPAITQNCQDESLVWQQCRPHPCFLGWLPGTLFHAVGLGSPPSCIVSLFR